MNNFRDSEGTPRCAGCDVGVLHPSNLKVWPRKRGKDETLWSCWNCGRCCLVSKKRNTQRLYLDLFDYRAFIPLLNELSLAGLERFHAQYYGDIPYRVFKSAFEVALNSREPEISADSNTLF